MFDKVIVFLMSISLAGGIINGRLADISTAALGSCSKAVEVIIMLAGPMALWSGLMRIAEKSGITSALSRLISPVTALLFRGIRSDSRARKAVSMNITANLLGLGNAATPTGIEAAKALDESGKHRSRNIAMLVVLNTASIQLFPTTVASIRLAHGSAEPFAVMIPILIVSFVSAAVGCIAVTALFGRKNDNAGN